MAQAMMSSQTLGATIAIGFLLLIGGVATCSPSAGQPLVVDKCSTVAAEAQTWVVPTIGAAADTIHLKVTYVEGLCMDVGSGARMGLVSLQQCKPAASSAQNFKLMTTNSDQTVTRLENGVELVHAASGLCVNLNRHGVVDLFDCAHQGTGSQKWQLLPSGELQNKRLCLAACKGNDPAPTPVPSLGPVVLNGSAVGSRFEGVWAMSANGAARLLAEYPEPTRSQILDLFFLPGVGTRWQALKVEIGGDVESSYGSMSSYQHVANATSFERGEQWWLIKEAQKRNPSIPLMALSWGMPAWVGDGETLSEGGADYHVDYLLGARQHHGIDFSWVGIWNEAPWTKEYILLLRQKLDAAGLAHVRITAADGGSDVISAASQDEELLAAIDSFGIHAHVLPHIGDTLGKSYFNTENDLVDGAPQRGFGATMIPGLNWPLAMVLNYVLANGTATMLCPGFHGWSMNLGRHQHGPAWFNDPWSGFYQLSAPFFTQAHVTQFTEVGWYFLGGGAAGQQGCTLEKSVALAQDLCALNYAALISPDAQEFSFVVINALNGTFANHTVATLNLTLVGALAKFRGQPLGQWRSTSDVYFAKSAETIVFPSDGSPLMLSFPPLSITTISNRASAKIGWANYPVPERTRFPVPFQPAWDKQTVDAPCHSLNAIYGAFEVAELLVHTDTHEQRSVSDAPQLHRVCQQSVPTDPGSNAWTHRRNGWPSAALPSGANFANYIVSVRARFTDESDNNRSRVNSNRDLGKDELGGLSDQAEVSAVQLCGRQPIWAPAPCQPADFSLGVCLTVIRATAQSNTNNSTSTVSWRLTEAHNQYHGGCNTFTLLANGTLLDQSQDLGRASAHGTGSTAVAAPWYSLGLSFSDDEVSASIDGVLLATIATNLSAGVAAIGTAWNIAHFSGFSLRPHPKHAARTDSFVFDILPSEELVYNFTGWAGMVVDLTEYPSGSAPFRIAQLGRFKSRGNTRIHTFAIAKAVDGSWLLPPSANLTVNMASCHTDLLGFCYSMALLEPLELERGSAYYLVASEEEGEAFVNMTKSATGADYSTYRDGDSLMTYRMPTGSRASPTAAGNALVRGRVRRQLGTAGEWLVEEGLGDVDTAYGPMNAVLVTNDVELLI